MSSVVSRAGTGNRCLKVASPNRGVLLHSVALAVSAVFSHPAGAQVAILQIQVNAGEGAIHAPGARDSRALGVVVTDETGRPVEGAAVSFHLPDHGPSGTFVNGLRTEVAVTNSHGRAAVRAIEFNRVPGRLEIRIVASKEQARAGTVSFQYIAGAGQGAATAAAQGGRHHRKKWVIIAAVAAGGGAAGSVLAGRSSGSPAGNTSALSIGPPSVTVGKP